MSKMTTVVRREFVERVRTKWFWSGTILGPVFFGGIILLRVLLASPSGVERHVAVVDNTTSRLGAVLVDALNRDLERFHFTRVAGPPRIADSLKDAVNAKEIDGFMTLSETTFDSGTVEYSGSNVSSLKDMEELQTTLVRELFAIRLERRGIDPKVVSDAG